MGLSRWRRMRGYQSRCSDLPGAWAWEYESCYDGHGHAQVEKDEEYIKAVAALGTSMEELVKANNAIDIYEEYFAGRNLDYSTEKPEAKTIAGLMDPTGSQRGAQYVCWHPDGSSRLAVAHSILEFQKLQVRVFLDSTLFWSLLLGFALRFGKGL